MLDTSNIINESELIFKAIAKCVYCAATNTTKMCLLEYKNNEIVQPNFTESEPPTDRTP